MQGMSTIRINISVRRRLQELKYKHNFRTLNDVIDALISFYERAELGLCAGESQ